MPMLQMGFMGDARREDTWTAKEPRLWGPPPGHRPKPWGAGEGVSVQPVTGMRRRARARQHHKKRKSRSRQQCHAVGGGLTHSSSNSPSAGARRNSRRGRFIAKSFDVGVDVWMEGRRGESVGFWGHLSSSLVGQGGEGHGKSVLAQPKVGSLGYGTAKKGSGWHAGTWVPDHSRHWFGILGVVYSGQRAVTSAIRVAVTVRLSGSPSAPRHWPLGHGLTAAKRVR
jgi:hypothetical protein